ncbi:MAG: ABC transporter ATP-binding protein [Nitrososphaerota archaeon]|nr:ABC transporter ATP-binding protein [Nitrososphaerota archaeon]
MLSVRQVSKAFGGIQALAGVDLELARNEKLGVIGPNGSGKTTLLNVLSGVYRPDTGSVFFEDGDITSLPAYKRTGLGIARTFQIPRPFWNLSVLDNVRTAIMYQPSSRKARGKGVDDRELAVNQLAKVGLESKSQVRPKELTQVDMRRLELGRALATGPKLLLLDEVMAGLTPSEVDEVLKLLEALNAEGVAFIMVEHIMEATMSFCDKVEVLSEGKEIVRGTPEEVVNDDEVVRVYLGE